MSLTLDTVSSPVVDGRCAGCGRFISRNESHFHGPPRKFSGPPRAHLYQWAAFGEGGMVTRCDDPKIARELLIAKYRRDVDNSPGEAEVAFPEGKGEVQRGRINVLPPESEFTWWWMRLDDHAKGPGITTAVVWSP